jgi:hypothetical protein
MHVLAPLAAAVALGCVFGCSSSAASDSVAGKWRANLQIAVWPQGKRGADPQRWTLRCGPVGGTLPAKSRACRRLLALKDPFAASGGGACIQIYGGPQVAEVRGRLRGAPIGTTFTRTDGCQIERWNRVRFLFPSAVSR